MASLPYGDYVPTEADLFKLVGDTWPERLRKDYIAGKFSTDQLLQLINANIKSIEDLELALQTLTDEFTTFEGVVNGKFVVIDGQIAGITLELDTHIAAQVAHGSTGDIVGNLDYAESSVGGVVWLASAVGDAVDSATTPPSSVAAAPAAYNQAYEQTQADAINDLIGNVIDLQNALNSAIDIINSSLATERTAKQRAT